MVEEANAVLSWNVIGVQDVPRLERVLTSTGYSIIRSHGGLYGDAQLTWRGVPQNEGFLHWNIGNHDHRRIVKVGRAEA